MNVRRLLSMTRPHHDLTPIGPDRLAAEAFVLTSCVRRSLMLIALAFALAVLWILAFFVFHVSFAAIHTLAFGAAVAVLVHFIRIHRVHRIRQRL